MDTADPPPVILNQQKHKMIMDTVRDQRQVCPAGVLLTPFSRRFLAAVVVCCDPAPLSDRTCLSFQQTAPCFTRSCRRSRALEENSTTSPASLPRSRSTFFITICRGSRKQCVYTEHCCLFTMFPSSRNTEVICFQWFFYPFNEMSLFPNESFNSLILYQWFCPLHFLKLFIPVENT